MPSKLILLSGMPASGKSTYALKLSKEIGYVIECADTWRGILSSTGDEGDQSKNLEIFFSILPKQIKKHLNNGNGVIIDVTGVNKRTRKIWTKFAQDSDTNIDCHWFRPNIDQSLEWNKNRKRQVPEDIIVKYELNYREPGLEEGFKEIVEVDLKK